MLQDACQFCRGVSLLLTSKWEMAQEQDVAFGSILEEAARNIIVFQGDIPQEHSFLSFFFWALKKEGRAHCSRRDFQRRAARGLLPLSRLSRQAAYWICCIWNVWGPLSELFTQVPRSQGQRWERAASCICLPRCSPENVLMDFSFNRNHNSRGLFFNFFDCAAEDWMTSLRSGP